MVTSSIWLPVSDIVICGNKLINEDVKRTFWSPNWSRTRDHGVGIERDGSARAADFRNTNQHFEGQNKTCRDDRQQILSAARSTTLPPLRGRKGQQARLVGRYVSNAAGRNKGGAPIKIDELIGDGGARPVDLLGTMRVQRSPFIVRPALC
jgi:hypothetical protein